MTSLQYCVMVAILPITPTVSVDALWIAAQVSTTYNLKGEGEGEGKGEVEDESEGEGEGQGEGAALITNYHLQDMDNEL